ncbi:CDP-alcohol phosphatidyltransferase family protein [uncultured Jatrophihabitans sp.]|uniref:CDP-alcohol phosphatidyltransferase family protein n=1 Tax=uncultured Jatrophihabitans sp. TaxID=1610747 RepID=UPI0035CC721D
MSVPMSPFRHTGEEFTPAQWGRAWAVHLFTTLGIVAAMLALRDVLVGDAKRAIVWLLLTLLIDGIDGPIARALEVERRVPLIDGFMLDLIIDYVTCVIVPACFMYEFKVVPQNNFGVAILCVMVFCSAIWFARKDMMTEDNWFRGHPAAWNLVGPLLYLLQAKTWFGAVLVLVLSLLCLSNMPYPHIARAQWMHYYTWTATVFWMGGISAGTLTLPHHYLIPQILMYAGSGYFVLLAVLRSLHNRRVRLAGGQLSPIHGLGEAIPATTPELHTPKLDSTAERR